VKNIFAALSICALCCAYAPAQKSHPAAMTDQQFVDFVAQTDMTEAHLGQLAADKATSQDVKDFAQMLVTDHTADYKTLGTLATKAGLNVPKGLDATHDKMIAPFEKLKGAAWDSHYEREMIMGHQKAIAQFKQAADSLQNADLKTYASQTIPTLEKHLQAAQDLMKNKGKKGASKM
jgi:putative membrane protein